jgi:serine/threonine protein kinase
VADDAQHVGYAPTAPESKPSSEQPSLGPGTVLGENFELVERLGGGGMGIVFRARDRRLGRDVAVKLLRTEPTEAGEHLRRLFEREACATAQLLHPNIVTLHAVGEHAGQPYLVLELLAGETLATRRGRLPLADVLAIMDRVLDALSFAHERSRRMTPGSSSCASCAARFACSWTAGGSTATA